MNKRIRSMIDEIFSDMKMTVENLALRDELLANAQARYEDAMAQGKGEEEALGEIAASLEDIYDLLEEMSSAQAQQNKDADGHADLSDALNKAFSALEDFSQAIMPEAKKLYGQMDDATGGMLGKLGRAARKGMRDAQKAAGEVIDKLTRENGEQAFDSGAGKEDQEDPAQQSEPDCVVADEESDAEYTVRDADSEEAPAQ